MPTVTVSCSTGARVVVSIEFASLIPPRPASHVRSDPKPRSRRRPPPTLLNGGRLAGRHGTTAGGSTHSAAITRWVVSYYPSPPGGGWEADCPVQTPREGSDRRGSTKNRRRLHTLLKGRGSPLPPKFAEVDDSTTAACSPHHPRR